MKTGLEDCYVIKNNKKLRMGYTTGSCAAGAARAAAKMLLTGETLGAVELMTPKGILLNLEILDIRREGQFVSCAVRKDGGDDPDMTNGMLIYAAVEKIPGDRVELRAGKGVGIVTKKGLEQPVGSPAINKVPRAMILGAVEGMKEQAHYEGGLLITISAPQGETVAKNTFNPRLGIVGGISILGTSGIVEPMSEAALIRSIELEMDMRLAQGDEYLLITPGNYGTAFLREQGKLPVEKAIKCSNFVGETLDMALKKKVKGILFVAHLGKFIKVAAGIMNTHSRQADGRMEILAANAIRAGGDIVLSRSILECHTTDEGMELLKNTPYFEKTIEQLTKKIQCYLDYHTYEKLQVGAVLFSNTYGYLGETRDASLLIKELQSSEPMGR